MKKNHFIFITIISTFLLSGMCPFVSSQVFALSTIQQKTIIYVDDDNILGPWKGSIDYPFQHIQEAINNSLDNDLIYIFKGTYNESLFINKSITLYGENSTIINGNYRSIVIILSAEDIILQNLIIQNSGANQNDAGVLLNAHHSTLINCTFYKTQTAIFTQNTSYHNIINCSFFNNGFGIRLFSAKKIIIKDCTFSHNAEGLICDKTSDIFLKTSYFHTNGRTCIFHKCQNVTVIECNISDNSVNHGGILINNCVRITILNSIIQHNGINLQITHSETIEIHYCTLSYSTHMAIVIDTTSNHINITHCDIVDGFRYGIYVVDKSTVILTHNNIYSTTIYGLYTKHSQCTIQENYWGSPHGPSISEFGSSDRIHMFFGRIKSYPWITEPILNSGAIWTNTKPYLKRTIQNSITRPIEFSSTDTDNDGVPDWWETKWGYHPTVWENHLQLDPDDDALTNIEECYTDTYGSNPFKKDIFLEIDWIVSKNTRNTNKPNNELIKDAEEAFELHNISLHIDIGDYNGGEEIPYISNITCTSLINLYWHYFLHDDMNNPRKGIFHYGLICDIGPDVNFPFMGWDQLDSFLISAEQLSEQYPLINRSQLILKASIHHLGHTLGLIADLFDGIDNLGTLHPFSAQWFKYRNYKSNMNYWYKYKTFSYSDGTHGLGDFNDYEQLDFSFFKNTRFPLTSYYKK